MKKEDILHLAAEEMQQDWSDLRFQDVFYKAYIQGAMMVNAEAEKLTAERDAALTQNSELVAQVEALREAAVNYREEMVYAVQSDEEVAVQSALDAALKATPTQCLRNIQGEAGRAGFVEAAQIYSDWVDERDYTPAADKYADRIKAGEL